MVSRLFCYAYLVLLAGLIAWIAGCFIILYLVSVCVLEGVFVLGFTKWCCFWCKGFVDCVSWRV